MNEETKEILFEIIEKEEDFISAFNKQKEKIKKLNIKYNKYIPMYFYVKEKQGIRSTSMPLGIQQEVENFLFN